MLILTIRIGHVINDMIQQYLWFCGHVSINKYVACVAHLSRRADANQSANLSQSINQRWCDPTCIQQKRNRKEDDEVHVNYFLSCVAESEHGAPRKNQYILKIHPPSERKQYTAIDWIEHTTILDKFWHRILVDARIYIYNNSSLSYDITCMIRAVCITGDHINWTQKQEKHYSHEEKGRGRGRGQRACVARVGGHTQTQQPHADTGRS